MFTYMGFCDPHQKVVHHQKQFYGRYPLSQLACNLQWFHRSSCEHACALHLDVGLEKATHICDTNELHGSHALQNQGKPINILKYKLKKSL